MRILATEMLGKNCESDTEREGDKKISDMGILASIYEFQASSRSASEFPLEFLGNEESGIGGSLKFAPLHILGSNSARISNSIETVEAASIDLSLTGRNPSAELLALTKDNEVELVIHPVNFFPANLNSGEWISDDDSLASENYSRVNEAVVSKKAKTCGPEESAYATQKSAVEQLLNSEERKECGCGNKVKSVNPRSVDTLFQRASYTRNQSKQKRKLAS